MSFWEDWNNPEIARTWNSALDALDSGLKLFAGQHPEAEFQITRTHWDSPEMEIRWTKGNISRNVCVVIEGRKWPLELRFEGNIWDPQHHFDHKVLGGFTALNAEEISQKLVPSFSDVWHLIDSADLNGQALATANRGD